LGSLITTSLTPRNGRLGLAVVLRLAQDDID